MGEAALLKQVVSYGGGVNSVAMLLGLLQHGERPDAITFSDTGGEKPHTYGHMWEAMQPWCERAGFPSITILRGEQPAQVRRGSLETECLQLGALPSKAYGGGQCSEKWKIDPQQRWARRTYPDGYAILIGFHAGEQERALRQDNKPPPRRYPLIEWGWDYEDCQAVILKAGLPSPGKSACYFCPSTTKPELLQLRRQYPDLLARALEMERKAMAGEGPAPASGIGLGRRFTWREFFETYDRQGDLFPETPEQCGEGCFT